MSILTEKKKGPFFFSWQINPPVFLLSLALVVLSVALVLVFEQSAEYYFELAQSFVASKGGWFYTLAVNFFIVFCLYLALSKYGNIKIGGPEAKKEFSTMAWFAMLFSAGIGNGLVLFSIADPVRDFQNPARLAEGAAASLKAQEAINFSFLHHGIHGWGIYTVIGLALAYFTYNRKMPLTIRSVFYPLLGERIHGWMGHVIDIVAVVATLFGLATTLGFGVGQINAGFTHVFGFDHSLLFQLLVILAITAIATLSVVSGVNKGVKILSQVNIWVAVAIFSLVLLMGPTAYILGAYIQNVGSYLINFVDMATWTETYRGTHWQDNTTIMYWGWWASWSPFVGTFIARVSKGRTIKEFILVVLILPALVTFLWFSAFGGLTMRDILQGDTAMISAVNENISTALYVFFEKFPLAMLLKVLGMILICSFIITSTDSGALVVDSITSGGKMKTPAFQRILWASLSGIIAGSLLSGGGLVTLQAAVTISGLPFTAMLVFMCFSLLKAVKEDYKVAEEKPKPLQPVNPKKEVLEDVEK
ncbi:BCCT family transporter [Litoribacter populi]|uniref:BCCT family transporter n=1 Tax=Litoribacter populi TaxID=2598460 RepID=UPI00117CAAD8|nr:BCCT family transporter [Litoribacter populi]